MTKEFRTGGSTRGTVGVEILNLLNSPWYAALASSAFGSSSAS